MTSITSRIRAIAFPANFSAVFACMCDCVIYIFRVDDQRELLTIKVEQDNATLTVIANCIEFMQDGKSIVTGWSDGKVRVFTP
jgi:cilia- and flagella-associated protein 52